MDANRYRRLKEIFHDASERSAEDRTAFLDEACAGDAELRREVEGLLDAESGMATSMFERTTEMAGLAREALQSFSQGSDDEIPDSIGPYQIVRQIGEGGMGVVYEAEQLRPVRRSVALKIIKLGMDTKQVMLRFEAERQALAMMSHPSIAGVLDAGATDTGRPYFVMELVDGVPITTSCDEHNLSLRERLALFVQVCKAVQHAHQKGIIHRDLKPGNILVTRVDGKPVPKVIDFGVAKATEQKLTEQTMFTEPGQFIGTPAYMSPEQAGGEEADIDTRADVYALGIVLYELLVGATPFDLKTLRKAALDEVKRLIREHEPTKPSTRLSGLGEVADAVAARRGVDRAKLRSALRGDLDWVVMKALEKDRTRRYETANGFAADIERFLRDEPVSAGPPTAGYRARKFVKRNRGAVIAASFVGVALILGVIGTSVGLVEANRQRRLAEENERLARVRADELQQVSDFQAKMLREIDPNAAGEKLMADLRERFEASLAKAAGESGGEDVAEQVIGFGERLAKVNATDTAIEMIDTNIIKPAALAVEAEFADQPVVAAALRDSLAEAYRTLGAYDKAIPLLREALDARRTNLGDADRRTMASVANLGATLRFAGDRERALPLYEEALALRQKHLPENDPDVLSSLNNMGSILQDLGRHAEAESYYRRALAPGKESYPDEPEKWLTTLNNMGSIIEAQGRFAEAEPYYRQALDEKRELLGEDHPSTINTLNNLGTVLMKQGKPDEAEVFWRDALKKNRRVRGENHIYTLVSLNNMGYLLMSEEKYAEAEPFYREGMEKFRERYGDAHPTSLTFIANNASLMNKLGKHEEAVALLTSTLDAAQSTLTGGNVYKLGKHRLELGVALTKLERFAEAESQLLSSRDIYVESKGEDSREARSVASAIHDLYKAWQLARPDSDHEDEAHRWGEVLSADAIGSTD